MPLLKESTGLSDVDVVAGAVGPPAVVGLVEADGVLEREFARWSHLKSFQSLLESAMKEV